MPGWQGSGPSARGGHLGRLRAGKYRPTDVVVGGGIGLVSGVLLTGLVELAVDALPVEDAGSR